MHANAQPRAVVTAGALLVTVGLIFLVGRSWVDQLDWVAWPLVVGAVVFVVALAIGGEAGAGFAGLAGIVFMAGVVLAAQWQTDAYESWAYAWALVAPGGVGLGLALYGALTRQWQLARDGFAALVVGLAIFLVLFLFFEGVIGLGGGVDRELINVIVPLAIVALGAVLLVGALVTPRLARATPAAAATGSRTSAVAATGTPTSAVSAGEPVIELEGAAAADVAIAFGAGKLAVTGPAAAGRLVDGAFGGGVKVRRDGAGRVHLSTPGERLWSFAWGVPPFDWRIGLTAEVPLRLGLEVGAAQCEVDLSALRVEELRFKSGAAESWLTLPARAGFSRVLAEGGATAVHFRVPDGVAVRIRSAMALGTTDVDEQRFPRDPLDGWASPDFATAANRIELELRGGIGSFSVR